MFPVLILAATLVAQNPSPAAPSAGDAAFAAGDFTRAFREYNDAVIRNSDDADAYLGLGTLDLYRNDWRNARTYLERAEALAPNDQRARMRLAVLARRMPKAGVYTFDMPTGRADVPLVSVDPVPVVHATIDGKAVSLAIDTSQRSIALTPAAAANVGLIAGERLAEVALPGLTVRAVDATLLPGPLHVGTLDLDGAIGTVFLTHFIPTIDTAKAQLTLQRWEDSRALLAQAKARNATIEPMWLVGDELLLANARAAGGPAGLFALQTGIPGAAALIGPATTPVAISVGSYTQTVATEALSTGTFERVPFAIAGALRASYFRPAQLTLDFASMQVILTQ